MRISARNPIPKKPDKSEYFFFSVVWKIVVDPFPPQSRYAESVSEISLIGNLWQGTTLFRPGTLLPDNEGLSR